jgi:5-methyltetrahydropteroyltriglutamate--homocysteine methyltransferase
MPRLIAKPFRYHRYAEQYVEVALRFAHRPLKQAVISPSALSLMYPPDGIRGYSREQFLTDLLNEHIKEVRGCFAKGAASVQVDFTEGRLAMKIDPTGTLLSRFVELNNLAFARLSPAERTRLGVHTCPGGDLDSTHSADVDYAELLPSLFTMEVTNFFVALAGEPDRKYVLRLIRDRIQPHQRVFVGVTSPIRPGIETGATGHH